MRLTGGEEGGGGRLVKGDLERGGGEVGGEWGIEAERSMVGRGFE